MELKTMDLKIQNKEKGIYICYLKSITIDNHFINDFNKILDHMESIDGNKCLITTSTHKKIYSAGINFQQFSNSEKYVKEFLTKYIHLLGRLMKIGFITICNINGCFIAGGFMFAMAHDYRGIIENGYGYMSEINFGVGIPKGMLAPIMAKMNPIQAREINYIGEKIYTDDLLKYYMVDYKASDNENLLKKSITLGEKVAPKGNFGDALTQIKEEMYRPYLNMCYNEPIDDKIVVFMSRFPKL